MERERRRSPRRIFIASAELYEEQSDVRVASRVSELSLNGCYLDMMNPFPPGTMIHLKIFSGDLTFRCKAGSDKHPYGLLADQRLSGIFRFPPDDAASTSLHHHTI